MSAKMKKVLSLILALVLLLTSVPGAALAVPERPDMQDVSPGDWFYSYVTRSFHFGLTMGTGGDGFRFEPYRNVTRAEFVTMLGRLHEYFNEPINALGAPSFYYYYLNWAVAYGIVHGDGDGDLMPHVLITREQMAVIVYRYIDVFGLERHLPPQPDDDAVPGDYQDISIWARHEVWQMMYRYRLMRGSGAWPGVFNPQANSSRAEALAVLVRLANVLYNANRFVLTISVEETSLPQGEPFIVNVELWNNSGEDHEIYSGSLFWPHILDWDLFDEIERPPSGHGPTFFEADSIIRNRGFWGGEAWRIGSALEPGTHELRFNARFILNWGPENPQFIEVWSSTITLMVQ